MCVCAVSFYFRQYQDFDTFVQLLRARAFSYCRSDSPQKNLRVFVCVGENRSVQEVTLAIERDG